MIFRLPFRELFWWRWRSSRRACTFWYFVLPLNDQRDGLQKEVAKLKAENDRNEAFRQQQTEYLNRIKQLESQLETLRSIVPDEQATDEFMRTVFADGAGTGTQIRTFIPKPPVVKDYYVEVPFAVRLDGTYYNLLSFFDRLAHEQRIMSVSGLSLGSPGGRRHGGIQGGVQRDGGGELRADHLLQQAADRGGATSQEKEIVSRMRTMAKHRLQRTRRNAGNAALALGGSRAGFGVCRRVGQTSNPEGSRARRQDRAGRWEASTARPRTATSAKIPAQRKARHSASAVPGGGETRPLQASANLTGGKGGAENSLNRECRAGFCRQGRGAC